MLTVKQVAARLQIGQVTVLRWLRSGKLLGVKPGGTRIGWRVPVTEVERVERGNVGRLGPDDECASMPVTTEGQAS